MDIILPNRIIIHHNNHSLNSSLFLRQSVYISSSLIFTSPSFVSIFPVAAMLQSESFSRSQSFFSFFKLVALTFIQFTLIYPTHSLSSRSRALILSLSILEKLLSHHSPSLSRSLFTAIVHSPSSMSPSLKTRLPSHFKI